MLKSYPEVLLLLSRLKKAGLLKKGEEDNVDNVAAAKAKFKEKYGTDVEETGRGMVI